MKFNLLFIQLTLVILNFQLLTNNEWFLKISMPINQIVE